MASKVGLSLIAVVLCHTLLCAAVSRETMESEILAQFRAYVRSSNSKIEQEILPRPIDKKLTIEYAKKIDEMQSKALWKEFVDKPEDPARIAAYVSIYIEPCVDFLANLGRLVDRYNYAFPEWPERRDTRVAHVPLALGLICRRVVASAQHIITWN